MSREQVRRVSSLLLAVLAPFALDGCVSVGLSRSAFERGDGSAGAVELAVYEKERDRDAGVPVPYPVLSELHRTDEGGDLLIARSMAATWQLPDLPPGAYRVEISKRIDGRGDIEPLARAVRKGFDVKAGQRTTVAVVLRKVPVVWIVLAAITVVVLVVLSIDWLKDARIPLPHRLPVPPVPFPVVVVTDFYVPFGVASRRAGEEGPAVADVFPASGSRAATPRVTVSFLLTRPLAEDGIERGAVLAIGSKSGEFEGVTSWSPEEQLLRFRPSRVFSSREKVTVTLDLEKLVGADGRHGSGKTSTTFMSP